MATIETALTRLLGIRHPILLAPMGSAAGGKLAAAVTHAGGLGLLGSGYADERAIRRTTVAYRVPCITTISGARAAAEAVASRRRDPIRVEDVQAAIDEVAAEAHGPGRPLVGGAAVGACL